MVRGLIKYVILFFSFNIAYASIGTKEISFKIPNTERVIVAEIYYPNQRLI